MLELAQELGANDAVRRVGLLRASASEEEARHVRAHAQALHEDGFPAELVDHSELPDGAAATPGTACSPPTTPRSIRHAATGCSRARSTMQERACSRRARSRERRPRPRRASCARPRARWPPATLWWPATVGSRPSCPSTRAASGRGGCTWWPPSPSPSGSVSRSCTRASATSTGTSVATAGCWPAASATSTAELVHRRRAASAERLASGSSASCARTSERARASPITGPGSSATPTTASPTSARCQAGPVST